MLKYIRQNLNVSKANVVTSMWKEYEKNEMQFFNWVDSQRYQKIHLHTSGHGDIQSLKIIADYLNPKKIIPVHTQNKKRFKDVFQQEIILLEDNESFNLH